MSNKVNRDYPTKEMTDKQLKEVAIANLDSTATDNTTTPYPTEIVQLPSKGKLYPKNHPLSNGTIEMKYMTAKEEDILTNQSFIANGVVLDKLFQALIVTPINYNDLFLGDKNAIMIAARVLGYGKEYPIIAINNQGDEVEHIVDLTQLNDKKIDWSIHEQGINEFEFELPASKHMVTVKILTQGDQKKIDQELKGLRKLKKNAALTTMLKHTIIGLDGDTDNVKIRKFIDTELLALDSRALRKFLKSLTPDINLSLEIPDGDSGDTFRSNLNIGIDFFWPDAEV